MIISHKHKFIFIKPQKTAGTSVELMLSRICGEDDVITPLGFDPDPDVRIKHKGKNPQNYYRKKPLKNWQLSEMFYFLTRRKKPNLNYWEHLQADFIRQYVGDDIWQGYKKISIVRNPWDHAVSWFKWQETYGYEGTENGKFEEYLINNYRSLWPFYTVKHGLYDIDFMIHFENINQDIQELFSFLNIDEQVELPITKNHIRKQKHFKDYYSKKHQIDIVYQKANNVIDKFGYQF